MKFSIITPTHKRADKLTRAVTSVIGQTYHDWEMIIVNDSPSDTSYEAFASSINDSRIHYHINETNKGVNFTRNKALDKVSADSAWIIFLDDDDYLAPDTLRTFHDLILLNQDKKWLTTNRAHKNGKPVTNFPLEDHAYSYAWSYLILKRCKGDATHCIENKLITHIHARFSTYVKQAEEWFFFYQIGLHSKMYYHSHNSTITDGYDTSSGLNFRKRTRSSQFETVTTLLYEGSAKKMARHATFIIYILIRYLRVLIKK